MPRAEPLALDCADATPYELQKIEGRGITGPDKYALAAVTSPLVSAGNPLK
jgi:hypothetical protein